MMKYVLASVVHLLFFLNFIFTLVVNSSVYGLCSLPKTGIDSTGNSIVVWQSSDSSGNLTIQVSKCTLAGTWSTPVSFTPNGPFITPPVLVVDPLNNAVAIWSILDNASGNYFLYGSMLIAGGTGNWTTPVLISNSTTSVQPDYSLSINSNKNIIAAWSAYDSTYTFLNIYTSKAKIGTGWSTPVQISQ